MKLWVADYLTEHHMKLADLKSLFTFGNKTPRFTPIPVGHRKHKHTGSKRGYKHSHKLSIGEQRHLKFEQKGK